MLNGTPPTIVKSTAPVVSSAHNTSTVFVAHDHEVTYDADTTLNNSGTPVAPIVVKCLLHCNQQQTGCISYQSFLRFSPRRLQG